MSEYESYKPRRRSNSQSHHEDMLPNKFEVHEHEPVFEEDVHGAFAAEDAGAAKA